MIKGIVVDMDGTFLNDEGKYNESRFNTIYNRLQEKNIKFIVASGNQYAQLKTFFKGKNVTYLAENGALVVDNEKEVMGEFDPEFVQEVISYLTQLEETYFLLCGVKSAYTLKTFPQKAKEFAQKYYFALEEVENFNTLPEDTFIKFALTVPKDKTGAILQKIQEQFPQNLEAVSSGHGSIDLIIPGVTKGDSLKKLLPKWHMTAQNLLIFGDGGNDLTMLELTPYSYAMENASDQVKAVAKHLAPSNNHEGVLEIIERYVNN